MKFSYKAGVGFLASMALFSAIAQGDATVISQTRTIDYYVQDLDTTTGQPIGSPQLGASKSAPDFAEFSASVGNFLGTYAEQGSSISGLSVEGIAFANTIRTPTGIVNYIGDSETSVTYQLNSSMIYSFSQDAGYNTVVDLLGPNSQSIPLSGTTTGTIGLGQWTIQAITPPGGGDYNFEFSLTPEPATMGIMLVPLLIARRRCRG